MPNKVPGKTDKKAPSKTKKEKKEAKLKKNATKSS